MMLPFVSASKALLALLVYVPPSTLIRPPFSATPQFPLLLTAPGPLRISLAPETFRSGLVMLAEISWLFSSRIVSSNAVYCFVRFRSPVRRIVPPASRASSNSPTVATSVGVTEGLRCEHNRSWCSRQPCRCCGDTRYLPSRSSLQQPGLHQEPESLRHSAEHPFQR